MKRNNIKYIDDRNGYVCEGCGAYGKQCRTSHPTNTVVAKRCLDVVHVDLGEMNEPSLGGAKYFLIFKDDYSHFRPVYFLKNKSEAVDKLIIYLNLVKNQFGWQVKKLKSDNGTEIKSVRSRTFWKKWAYFISDQLRTHQNRMAESKGRCARLLKQLVPSFMLKNLV